MQLRCPDDVSGDIGGCSARTALKGLSSSINRFTYAEWYFHKFILEQQARK